MISPETNFYTDEQHAFDSVFPPKDILDYEEDGLEDWVELFDVLEHFECFPSVKPEARVEVTKLFLQDRNGSKMRTKETPEGLRVYKRNVTPLLKASLTVFWLSFDHYTDDAKALLNKVFSPKPLSNAERDWQK